MWRFYWLAQLSLSMMSAKSTHCEPVRSATKSISTQGIKVQEEAKQ